MNGNACTSPTMRPGGGRRPHGRRSARAAALLGLLVLCLLVLSAAPAGAAAAAAPTRAEQVTTAVTTVRTVRLTQPAGHVAVYWRGAPQAHVTVAFASDGRHFGRPVAAGRDELGRRRRSGTTYGALLAADGAVAVRIRSDRPLARLTTLALSDGAAPAAVAVAHIPFVRPAAQPPVVARSQWGADESLMTWAPKFYQTRKLIVHHTATTNDYADRAAAASEIRAIYYYHAVTQNWGDIGYNFLIDRFGTVYEGRYSRAYAGANPSGDGPVIPWSVAPTAAFPNGVSGAFGGVTAAHSLGWNSGTMGVAVLGTYTSTRISRAARASLVALLAWEANRNGIDPLLTEPFINPVSGATITTPNIGGQLLYLGGDGPGTMLDAELPGIRREVMARILAAETTPPTVTGTSPVAGATGVAPRAPITATFSEAADAATVNDRTVLLTGPGATPVAARVCYDARRFTATLRPVRALACATTYTVTIVGGSSGLKDRAGNPLAADVSWTFTTTAPVTP